MQIYGKQLQDILASLPWQMKIVVFAGALFILFSILYVPYVIFNYGKKLDVPGPLTIHSGRETYVGFTDPSAATDGVQSYLAFTTIRQGLQGGPPRIDVHIGTARKNCENFTVENKAALPSIEEEIIGPDGVTPVKKGIWRVETPTLVYDPDDKGREWKMFAYKYFWAESEPLARLYGMIVYSHTSDPAKQWAREEWLFSANDQSPPTPYNKMVQQKLNNLDPSLEHVYFYARPSAVYDNGVLLMSLTAYIKGRSTPDRIILIASTDHGKSWRYLGTPLAHADAARAGYTKIAGATLLMNDGSPMLAAVFGNDQTDADGTFILPFTDVAKAEIARDKDGVVTATRHIARLSAQPTKTGGGFATYESLCGLGILTSEFSGIKASYQIFKTYMKPLEE